MCDFGSSNATLMENTALPDMDALLDQLENESLLLVTLQPQLASTMDAVCHNLTDQPMAMKSESHPSWNDNTGPLAQKPSPEQRPKNDDDQYGLIISRSGCIEEAKCNFEGEIAHDTNGRRQPPDESIEAVAEADVQITAQQLQKISTPILAQRLRHIKDGQTRAEESEKALKHVNDHIAVEEEEDIFDQIDLMAAKIKAEDLRQEIEEGEYEAGANLSEHASSELASLDNKDLEAFVEEMIASVLAQVMSEQTYCCCQVAIDAIRNKEQQSEIEEDTKVAEAEGGEQTKGDKDKTDSSNTETEIQTNQLAETQKAQEGSQLACSQLASSSHSNHSSTKNHRNDSLAIVHDLSVALNEFKLTESELQLGKKRPYWIPDEECLDCMLCATRFSIVNRRHHCRACGRVLCRLCCSQRRLLAYMEEKEGKQRVCIPCNRTLDRIEEYEQRRMAAPNRGNAFTDDLICTEIAQNSASDQRTRDSATDHSNRRQSVDDAAPSNSSAWPKKKSLLKQPTAAAGDPSSTVDGAPKGPNTAQTSEGKGPMFNSMNAVTTSKRTVTFRDGVNPGHDGASSSTHSDTNASNSVSVQSAATPSYQWLISGGSDRSISSVAASNAKTPSVQQTAGNSDTDVPLNDNKKLPRKLSRRSKERRMEEESQSLLILKSGEKHCRIWLVERLSNGAEEMVRRELADVASVLSKKAVLEKDSTEWTIAIRRNFHLRIERRKIRADDVLPTLAVSTHGLATIGVDELFLAFQYEPAIFSGKLDPSSELLALLQQFELIFQQCLDPHEYASVDHQMGIRKCVSRMTRLYPFFRKDQPLFGHKVSSILFHRPHPKQSFANLAPPSRPFLVGVFVQAEELPWAMCVPCRLLLRLGMLSGVYPFPVVNRHRQQPLFTTDAVQFSVLKVLNDFRHWSYRIARLCGCSVAIRDASTDVILPMWALDDVRQIVASNRNMIGWAMDELCDVAAGADEQEHNAEIDSHLVSVQEEANDGSFSSFTTRIFSANHNSVDSTPTLTKKVIGASFVIFDGALRGNEQLLVSLVEDGLVVRLNADLMEQLVKSLIVGDPFSVTNDQEHRFSISFRDPNDGFSPIECVMDKSLPSLQRLAPGALRSPIDGRSLDGQIQYGLDRSRLLRSLIFFQFSSEWALRLSAVINMLPGKFPSALQPRFFDLCEQLVTQIVPTLEPFLQELVAADQRSISLRVHVDGEAISYETETWPKLTEQHFVWTVTLDEKLIPFLCSLCAWLPSVFFVELHTFIVSTRPLPALGVPDTPGDK